MHYRLYAQWSEEPIALSRRQAQAIWRKAALRHYAPSCSCKHCRTYVIVGKTGLVSNLRISTTLCH